MQMPALIFLAPVFLGIALMFLAVAVADFLKKEGKYTPARRTWVRICCIFAGIGIGLSALQLLFPFLLAKP
jgi:hypothetical protein